LTQGRIRVKGVTLHQFKITKDKRGNLIAGEFQRQIGFLPRRYFMVFDVPSLADRGEHAHKKCHQFLVCIKGSLKVKLDDGRNKTIISLNRINTGIHVQPMVWCAHYNYRPGTILFVFASHFYDSRDYIRSYREFQKLRKAQNS